MPHAPVFLSKSAEAIENKKVTFLKSAKKCKKEQKTAQEHANKGDRCWGIGVRERTIAMCMAGGIPDILDRAHT
jgi:hypothetical protein